MVNVSDKLTSVDVLLSDPTSLLTVNVVDNSDDNPSASDPKVIEFPNENSEDSVTMTLQD